MLGCVQEAKVTWDKNEIIGHRFELISTNSVEIFSFQQNGVVLATIGTTEALAAPILSWKMKQGKILIQFDRKDTITLEKVRVSEEAVEVIRNGESAKYTVNKKQEPQPVN